MTSHASWRLSLAAGIALLAIVMGIGRFAYTPLLPLMQADQPLSDLLAGWLASGNYLGYLLGALWLAGSRPGSKPLPRLRRQLLLNLACVAAMGLTSSPWLWLLWRFLAGWSSAAAFVLASGLVLLNDQYTRNLFIWGAGDLAQTDWHWVLWLLPRLLPVAVALALFAPRPLTLLRLGDDAARARGLSLWPVLLALLVAALWLSSLAITAVGLIGFIGLLTPNMARFFGARTARDELLVSTLLGGLLLLATDAIALGFSRVSTDLVPSGAAAALIGAPALLWLLRSRMHAQDQSAIRLPGEGHRRLQLQVQQGQRQQGGRQQQVAAHSVGTLSRARVRLS
ncbi:hypothetical protein CGX12_09150, partial [Zobellella denitrificans]|uniref:iron chelate uptake ABC transporter family permease subunit n=1 Tax=Zobellella denitrificans TaxID=347534 RepID=UPI000B9CC22C